MATTSALLEGSCPVVADHARLDPVFVLGYARSGTTLVCRLLLDHLGVNFGTESQFIIRHHQKLERYGDLRDDRRLRWLFEEISRERFFERTRRNFGFVFDIDRAMKTITSRTYAGALDTVFRQFATGQGLARWGDKTPEYCRSLPVLRELFPSAQYIHVVRDGRDAALSGFKTGFGPKNAYEAAAAWTETVGGIQQFGAALPAANFFLLRYEDLLTNPARTMKAVAAFLSIRNTDALAEDLRDVVRHRVRDGNYAKWRNQLSAREVECFEAYARGELQQFGYELQFRHRTAPVTRLESVYWRAQGAWRRVSNPKYWADNWYKLRLRLREITLPLRQPARL